MLLQDVETSVHPDLVGRRLKYTGTVTKAFLAR